MAVDSSDTQAAPFLPPGEVGTSQLEAPLIADDSHAPTPTVPNALMPPPPLVEETPRTPPMPVIPSYLVLSELGRGGMGVVYKAIQSDLQRPVALKMILHSKLTSQDTQARFRREALAVAKLRHPNIVQIYDVGDFEGQPFFALEFIDGISLSQLLRRQPQEPRASAQLVETLARAMQYAHEQGIVHRDLKPANILLSQKSPIAKDKSQPAPPTKNQSPIGFGASDLRFVCDLSFAIGDFDPKIADFGLAKDLSVDDRTITGAVLGTPNYMAPEQAFGRLEEIGPASDVHALGAILYEMLTGRPPYQGASAFDTLDQVRSSEPVPPRKLARKTPADLETICLKCLEKTPSRRYATAAELADDLHRFLAGEPIHARPVALWEKAGKWAKRHPAIAALSCSLAAILLAALIIVTWLWRDAADTNEQLHAAQAALVTERNAALQARDEAKAERSKAESINDFLVRDLVGTAKPSRMGLNVTVVQALDAIAKRVDMANLAPEVRAALHNTLGSTYQELGMFDKSEHHLRRTLELCRQVDGEDSELALLAANNLGMLLTDTPKKAEAALFLQQALAGFRRRYGDRHERTVLALHNYAALLYELGQFAEAEPLMREVLSACGQKYGRDHAESLQALHSYATVLRCLGRDSEAEPMAREALTGLKKRMGEDSPVTLAAMNNLAILLHQTGRLHEAEPLYRDVLARTLRRMGPNHRYRRIVWYNLAKLLAEKGEVGQAFVETELLLINFVRNADFTHILFARTLALRGMLLAWVLNHPADRLPPSSDPPPP